MSSWFDPYLRKGRSAAMVTGLNPNMQRALQSMYAAAPDHIRKQILLSSGYRSVATQRYLWNRALRKYGSAARARRMVAPPGRSQHGHGKAMDLKYLSPDAKKWVHANAGKHGLYFPMGWEPWHVELMGTRGSKRFTGKHARFPATLPVAAATAPAIPTPRPTGPVTAPPASPEASLVAYSPTKPASAPVRAATALVTKTPAVKPPVSPAVAAVRDFHPGTGAGSPAVPTPAAAAAPRPAATPPVAGGGSAGQSPLLTALGQSGLPTFTVGGREYYQTPDDLVRLLGPAGGATPGAQSNPLSGIGSWFTGLFGGGS